MELLTNHESFVRNGVVLALKKENQEKQNDKRQYRDRWHDVVEVSHFGLLVDPKSNLQCPKVLEETSNYWK